jgi:hypothetical protein
MVPRWLVQVLHPHQKFERPPFWNGWRYGIKKYGVEVHFQWHDLPTEFHKNLPIGSKVIWGDTQTDGQTDRLVISWASFSFLRKVGKNDNTRFLRIHLNVAVRRTEIFACRTLVTPSTSLISYCNYENTNCICVCVCVYARARVQLLALTLTTGCVTAETDLDFCDDTSPFEHLMPHYPPVYHTSLTNTAVAEPEGSEKPTNRTSHPYSQSLLYFS